MTVSGRPRERRSVGPSLSTLRLRQPRADVLTSRIAVFGYQRSARQGGSSGCAKTRLACHSGESAILIGGRRGISHWLENTQSEIPRGVYPERNAEILLPRLRDQDDSERARNDSLEGFFRSLSCHWKLQGWFVGQSRDLPPRPRLEPFDHLSARPALCSRAFCTNLSPRRAVPLWAQTVHPHARGDNEP